MIHSILKFFSQARLSKVSLFIFLFLSAINCIAQLGKQTDEDLVEAAFETLRLVMITPEDTGFRGNILIIA